RTRSSPRSTWPLTETRGTTMTATRRQRLAATAEAPAATKPAGNVRMLRDGDLIGGKARRTEELVALDPNSDLAAALFEAKAAELVEGDTPHPDVFRARRRGMSLAEFRRLRDTEAQAAAKAVPARAVEMRITADGGAFFLDATHPKGVVVLMT